MDFGRENSLFPLILIQVKSAAKRTVFGLKDKREKAFLPFKTQLFHIQVVRYASKEYEARIEELRRNEMEKKTAIVHAIHEYTTHEMSQFLSIDDLETLHENIESLAYGQTELYKPVRSKPDNQIKSPSLRHYAWNIGERLDISLIDRAKFIKTIFPHELENATIEYLCKNLRDSVPAIIAIDVPKNGDYHFSCMQTSADSDN